MSSEPYDPTQHAIRVLEEIRDSLDLIAGTLTPKDPQTTPKVGVPDREHLVAAVTRARLGSYFEKADSWQRRTDERHEWYASDEEIVDDILEAFDDSSQE